MENLQENQQSHTKRPQATNTDLIHRLSRVEGQVRGIKAMIDKGAYCDDVLTQISSVQSAMNSVAKILLKSHIETCIVPRLADGENEAINEMLKSISRII